jgi:hypothetical protein
LNFFETRKNSYRGPFGTVDSEYESHGQEIRILSIFIANWECSVKP